MSFYIRSKKKSIERQSNMQNKCLPHMNDQPKAHGHEWIRSPIQKDEVDLLLGIIMTMGVMGFPTVR